MRAIYATLSRVYSRTFYEANAFTFLILFGLVAGILSGKEHMALATVFVSAPVYTLIPVLIWMLYGTKVILYNRNVTRAPGSEFIRQMGIVPYSTQWASSIIVTSEQCLPVLLYASFLIIVAVQQGQTASMLAVIVEMSCILLVSAWGLRQQWRQPAEYVDRRGMLRGTYPYPVIALRWLLRSYPGLIIVTKCFNALLLFGLCLLHRFDEYDLRLLAMGAAITSGTSAFLLHHLIRFENHELSLVRTLPVSMWRRAFWVVIILVALQAPELATLRWNLPETRTIWELLLLALLMASIQFASFTYLLRKHLSLDQFSKRVFVMTLTLFVAVLFHTPIILLATGALIYSTLFARNYYRFEFAGEQG